jgi:multidrug efflux pump subunit AcrB
MLDSKDDLGTRHSLWMAALHHRKPVLFLVLVLALLGIWAYVTAPQSIFPQVSFSRIEVFAWAGDLPPEEMRATVTRRLETALQSLPVLESRSFTNQGSAEIELDFDPASDPRTDLQSVQAVVAAVRPSLSAVTRIETIIQHPNMEPIATYAITSTSLSQAELRYLIEQRVVPVFTGAPGLGRVTVFAGPGLEYRVTLDPQALAAAGTTVGEVARTIAAANDPRAAGIVDHGDQRRIVFAGEALNGPTALSKVAILDHSRNLPVPLGSLGRITLGEGPTTQQASFDGRHAVLLSAYPVIGADALTLRRTLDLRMPTLLAGLPSDVQVTRYWDQTRLISASQDSLRDAILIGALLALVVIYVFLRSIGITLVAAAIIPTAMAITILIIARAGMSLSLMSLGGLAIAVGLIIDEVIVVIESIARELAGNPGTPRRIAIARATSRIARALVGSTAANVVVFLPLGLLSGIPGFFFRALAITLGIALVVSILLSLGVAPMLTDMLWRSRKIRAQRLTSVEPAYVRVLAWALRNRSMVYLAALGVLAATAALFLQLRSDFLPALNEGEFEIIYQLPAGTSLAATDRIVMGLERIILADPAVEHEGRLQGVDTDGYEPTAQNAGTIRIWLKPGSSFDRVAGRLRDAFEKAARHANFEFHQLLEDQLNDLSGAPEPIQIEITGPDQERLIAIAEGLTDQISKIPGIVDAFSGVASSNGTIRVEPKDAMTVDELSDALGAALGGTVATQIRAGDGSVPVRVALAQDAASDNLESLEVPTKQGLVTLGTIAVVSAPSLATQVSERNGSRRLLITAGIEGRALSEVIPKIQAITALTALPSGYHLSLGGTYRQQQASFREFAGVLGIAVLLVFFVLLVTFNSFRIPLVILATIPLSPIGVLLALWLTHTPINVSSIMGLLLLVGIVVRNGILLIDAANRRRHEGALLGDAILAAGAERLRPILMTTFAAIGALLPLALGLGSGSEMLTPLAIAVIGGLSTSTAFTLVLIPVLYAAAVGGLGPVPLQAIAARPARAGNIIAKGLVGGATLAAIVLSVVAVVRATQKVDVPIEYPAGTPQDFAQHWFENHDRKHLGYVTIDQAIDYDRRVFSRYDANHDGRLTFQEMFGGIPADQPTYLAAAHARFDKMDVDHRGSISFEEMADYDRSFLKQIDQKGDGRITEEEWFAGTIGNPEWYPGKVN